MNWDIAQANWKILQGNVKEQWGKLTDDDLEKIKGRRDQLLGQIRKAYAVTHEDAEAQIKEWEARN